MTYDLYAHGIRLIFNRAFRRRLAISFEGQFARDLMRRARGLYKAIVLRSPSIGGKDNPLTVNVLVAAFVAAIYKAANGTISPEEMGEVFSDAVGKSPAFRLFAKAMGRKVFTRQWQDRRNEVAVESQKKVYPANFVSEFVYGSTINEYGIIYRECAICKLLQRENCSELAPQMCKFDYVKAKYMGCELTRTKTIGNGDELCDFWFTKPDRRYFLSTFP